METFKSEISDLGVQRTPDFELQTGSPESMVYHWYYSREFIFVNQSHMLICRYSEEEYQKEKAALDSYYDFRTKPMATGVRSSEGKTWMEPYVKIGDDVFHFLIPDDSSEEKGQFDFYKYSFLVFTNDVNQEIGYLAIDDFDLDEAENLADFINEEGGWKLVRRK